MSEFTNYLIDEKSPYLQQHAHNPVMWHPWGDTAFEEAKRLNRPVFLSIGYSTCHWCHVMERESFEDQEVAEAMNKTFIPIKVDREERPDLDSFYMNVCQMLTGGGGWPLNLILSPDRKPIFAFTYLPKRSRRNMMGIIELCSSVQELWRDKQAELIEQGQKIVDAISSSPSRKSKNVISTGTLQSGYRSLKENYDSNNGGFGYSPKFPSPHYLLFLMRYFYRYRDIEAIDMVKATLDHILNGGITDQIGFGFHRYSTDAEWKLPHFEKMLYDQAMILAALSEAFQVTGKREYSTAMTRTVEFLNNEMRDKSGGYYTALDADSEGEEGRFYTWTMPELIRVLGQEDAALFAYVFGCTPEGNYHEEATGRILGRNILFREHNVEETAVKFEIPADQVEEIIERSRKKLKEEREKRIRPGRDDKIISDMNGLLLWALAKAYRATNSKIFIESASGIAEFLSKNMIDENGRLLHRFSHSNAEIPGFVDDYAFCIAGFIELYQVSGNDSYLQTAKKLQSYQDKNFWSKEGGYYNTEMTDAPLKLKEYHDGAIPSGNSFSLNNLLYFAIVFGDPDMMNKADELAESVGESIAASPFYSLFMICGIDFAIGPSFDVVLPYNNMASNRKKMLKDYNPRLVLSYPSAGREDVANALIDSNKKIIACTLTECLPPFNSINEVIETIKKRNDV